MIAEWVNFPKRCDARGVLVPVEGGRDVPFEIKRIYYMHGLAPGGVRGGHAHRALRQVIVCVAGSCRVTLDDGRSNETVTLDDSARGLALPPMLWHEMSDFSPGCVLLVLASDHYDEADYIRDRAEFTGLAGRRIA